MCLVEQLNRSEYSTPEVASPACTQPHTHPLQKPCVLVEDLSLLEVEGGIWVGGGLLHEGLVYEHWVVDVLLQTQQTLNWGGHELWVAQSVSQVGVPLLVGDLYVVL